jgi:hypothetical protein
MHEGNEVRTKYLKNKAGDPANIPDVYLPRTNQPLALSMSEYEV